MTKIRDLTEQLTYDPAYSVPAQKSDGTTRRIALPNLSPSQGNGSNWESKTASFAAVAGGQYWIDATAGDVVVLLPTSPSLGQSIWLWRLDTTANKVLVRPGSNKINKLSGKDGVLAPPSIDRIEVVTYVDSTIGWLGQFGLLTYQNAPVGNLKLQLDFEGVNNSTIFTDSSPFNRPATVVGTAKLTTASPIAGTASGNFDGGGYVTFPASTDFSFGLLDFLVGVQIRTSQSGAYKAILTRDNGSFNSGCWAIFVNAGKVEVWCSDFSQSLPWLVMPSGTIADNNIHPIEWSRSGGATVLKIDSIVVASSTASVNIAHNNEPICFGNDLGFPNRELVAVLDNAVIQG